MTFTVVFFHAHPDDEALYTGGTMARLAAEGHRVVLVTATRGEAGLADPDLAGTSPAGGGGSLGDVREHELASAASALGCARLVQLGYADSGMTGEVPGAFSGLDPQGPALRVADLLREERADALVTYDMNGGYGHPDHVQVHKVGTIAAQAAGTAVELHATLDRDLLIRAMSFAKLARLMPQGLRVDSFEQAYSSRKQITHRIDVYRYLQQKRSALEAHRSQSTGGEGDRTVGWLLSLPKPVFRLVAGREWFVEAGRTPRRRPLDDIFASLRSR